ncbi:MAG: tetratricopeptide repeat protein [Bacteroidota bacterium]
MKRILFTILALLAFKVQAQLNLKFDKRFVECEDKWVTFTKSEDGTYLYGFIYIDTQAGLTFNNEGTFKQNANGTFEINKIEGKSIKTRLEPNNVQVAVIPENLFKDLQIEATPEWLKIYKRDENTVNRQYRWGFMYNGWNECAKALPFLLKANELDPNYEGLAVEIAYSYNCLGEYDKAVKILEEAIKRNPTDAYVIKEYIYCLTKINGIEKATKEFYKSTKILKEDTYNAENCYNIMQYYYNQKDSKNFKVWYKELKKWPNQNEEITKYAEAMKSELQ